MRILIIEDEHRIAQTIKKGLEQEHYVADIAYSGIEGYDLASSEDYDLLIVDLMLPGMDGITISKELRAKNIHTPLLMLTAKSQVTDKITGLNAGADDYLTKPFSFEELLARARALCRRPKNIISETLVAQDLILDSQKFSLTKAGKIIPLTSKEFSLLEYLMKNVDTILTKDQIIQHVWNYDSDILPNTVEVYVKNLRNKSIEIQTVRGFGYKLISH